MSCFDFARVDLMTDFPLADFHTLHLFKRVAEMESFTKAAKSAGLSQSAVTRQIQNLEGSLDVALFERTTRHVRLTKEGEFLLTRVTDLLSQVDQTFNDLKEEFKLEPHTLRIGASRSIGMAYLPGIFKRYQTHYPDLRTLVSVRSSNDLLEMVINGEIDVGIIVPPPTLPKGLQILHRFKDPLGIVAPPDFTPPKNFDLLSHEEALHTLSKEHWLLISPDCNTRALIDTWFETAGTKIQASMEMDNFDLLFNFVSMGMGLSLIPHRALPLYSRYRKYKRIKGSKKQKLELKRDLVVIARKNRKQTDPIEKFIRLLAFR